MKTSKSAARAFRLSAVVMMCVTTAACTTRLADRRAPSWERGIETDASPALRTPCPTQAPPPAPPTERPDNSFYRPGSGNLLARPGSSIAEASAEEGGDIKLNFQNANLLEVVKVILGDMLNVNYVVDPSVQGAVTMQTSQPLARSALIPTLELLLRMNEAALVSDGDVYRVLPVANAVTGIRAPQLGDSSLPLPRGYSVRVIPIKYVSANEMAQILEPFVGGGNNLLRVDTQRNVIIVAGSGEEISRLLETVRMFDVDRMKGMSVAMFTPDFVDAKTLGEELDTLLADSENGLMAGLVRFITIERLNGLMVVTPRPEYLAQIRTWVNRLDRDSGSAGRRLFIYRVQNGKATELAEVLTQLFERDDRDQVPSAQLAPGLRAATARSSAPATEGEAEPPPIPEPVALGAAGEGIAISSNAKVKILADEPNNALMILASAQEYRQILNAMNQLDVTPMQVMIDVTIAEVGLSDDLEYGVEWFFRNLFNSGDYTGTTALNLGGNFLSEVPGFSYAVAAVDGPRGVLNLLAEETNLSIISSPTLLVLNNQEASIQVGAEVPISTQLQQSTDSSNTNILNSVEYRDVGILLNVKPRVNAGGLVILEIEQESSQAPDAGGANITPRIQTRKINSTVAVQSVDTIILGGLIEDKQDRTERGVPALHKTPIFGGLFGSKSDNQDRTELLVLITPRAILDRNSALRVTEEFRRKLNSLIPIDTQNSLKRQTKESGPGTAPAAQTPAPSPALTQQVGAPEICERFGPFNSLSERDSVKSALGNSIVISEHQTAAREAESYHVRVPPQHSAETANALVATLQAAGMNDLLIYDAGELKNAISIGVFEDRADAERFLGQARALNVPAEIVTQARSNEPRYWLLTRRPVESTIPLDVKSNYEAVDCSVLHATN